MKEENMVNKNVGKYSRLFFSWVFYIIFDDWSKNYNTLRPFQMCIEEIFMQIMRLWMGREIDRKRNNVFNISLKLVYENTSTLWSPNGIWYFLYKEIHSENYINQNRISKECSNNSQ